MRNFKIGSGEAAMRFNGDDTSAAFTWNGTETFSITAGGLVLRNVATASLPSSPPEGTIVYDTTTDTAKIYTGSGWGELASGGGSLSVDAGNGIDFSDNTGTSATGATTTSELFDWYEEGTWTPNLWDTSLSSSESQTYSAQVGRFTRIGRVVFYQGYVAWTSLGSLTSGATVYIGPLPYPAVTLTGYNEPVHVGPAGGLNLSGAYALAGNINSAANFAQMYQFSATSGSAVVTFSELQSSGSISIGGQYIV